MSSFGLLSFSPRGAGGLASREKVFLIPKPQLGNVEFWLAKLGLSKQEKGLELKLSLNDWIPARSLPASRFTSLKAGKACGDDSKCFSEVSKYNFLSIT